MLSVLLVITSSLVVVAGLAVMALGNWRPYRLKFAAVALSTVSAIFLTYIHATDRVPDVCTLSPICAEYIFYGVVRNIAFVFFHITAGRDAIRLKDGERRKEDFDTKKNRMVA